MTVQVNTGTAVCGELVRGGGTCELDTGHRGYHSAVAYVCDGCSKRRRGEPYRWARDGEYERGLAFCFLCVLEDMKRYGPGE